MNAVHPSERAIIGALWREASRSGSRWSVRYRLRAKSGGYAWVTDQGEPVLGRNGQLRGHRGTIAMALPSDGDDASETVHYLEVITDHILTARRLAERSADQDLVIVLELVLFRLGQKLGRKSAESQDEAPPAKTSRQIA